MGYLYAFGAFLTIGSYLVLARFSSSKGIAFVPLMGLGLLGLALLLIKPLVVLWAHPLWFWVLMGSGFLWGLGQTFAYLAMEEISLSKAAVLFNLNSFLNIAVGILLFKEASSGNAAVRILLGGTMLFAGAWWVSRIQAAPAKERNFRKGFLLSLGAGFFWGVYFVPIKAIQLWAGAESLPVLSLVAGLALGGILPALLSGLGKQKTQWTPANIGWGVATCLLWGLGMSFFLSANQALGLSRAVPIVNSNTLLYAGWSLFVFKEIHLRQWPRVLGGTALAIAGVTLMATA